MTALLATPLLLGGSFFMLVAAVGVLRFPDLLTRMHAQTKAGALGVGMIFSGVAVALGDVGVALRALAVIALVLITTPVAAHLLARAAYRGRSGKLWPDTRYDAEACRAAPPHRGNGCGEELER